jgi:multimeric flavodoxin WrbA
MEVVMKVVAFSGSARKDGNTAVLVREVLTVLENEGIETELVQLSGETVRGCIACYQCYERKDNRCAVTGDVVNDCIEKMIAADGIILASPTYFADITSELKALIDRSGMVGRANGNLYRRKVGAAVVAVRRGGAVHAFDSINHFFLIGEMIVPGSNYWNLGFGKEKGEVRQDEEGMHTMRQLGENMAWLMKKVS